jgi:hypothetical protein
MDKIEGVLWGEFLRGIVFIPCFFSSYFSQLQELTTQDNRA